MTIANTIGAVSREAAVWYAIDWPAVLRTARRLPVRIVQAPKAGRWNKVKSLQRLLTHSYSGKVLAVRRVTENNGKKTPGVDQKIWKTPEDKTRAVHALNSGGYQIATPATCLHPEVGRQDDAPTRNSLHDRSTSPSTAFACARSGAGNQR